MLMRWLALLSLVVASSDAARRFKRSAETGDIVAEEIHEEHADGVAPGDLTLVFVSAMWRHGDRAPTTAMPGDQIPASNWNQGGGGYGQLTPTGMKQHFELGKKLKARFIDSKFLSRQYNAKEIYVRSTDVNRTMISAMSNLLGMYSQDDNANRNNTDYPSIPGWPKGYVPIPIHTSENSADSVGNPDFSCPRADDLWNLVKKSDEFIAYTSQAQVKTTLDFLSAKVNKTMTLDNLWEVNDGMFIEGLRFNNSFDTLYPWFKDIRDMIRIINNKAEAFQNGLLSATYKTFNIGNEIKKLRGGSLINNIRDHLKHKITCIDTPAKCNSNYFKNLKYYVVSAHDTTLAAYLATLEASDFVLSEGGYPHYSASVLTELHKAKDGSYYVRFLYHGDAARDFDVITPLIAGAGTDFAPLSVFEKFADKYNPGDVAKLCNTKVALA